MRVWGLRRAGCLIIYLSKNFKFYKFHVSAALPYRIASAHRLDAVAPALISYDDIRQETYLRPTSVVPVRGETYPWGKWGRDQVQAKLLGAWRIGRRGLNVFA